jgi:RecA-family ATPase
MSNREAQANGLRDFSSVIDNAMESKLENHQRLDNGFFIAKTANEWIELAKTSPKPKMLFGEFWYEGELGILFADTNLGKSILAVEIGNSISRGEIIKGFASEAKKQLVLYFDFELSCKQFENRYSKEFEQHYNFDDNFIRIEINPNSEIPNNQTIESFIEYSLEKSVKDIGAKILIIDNITYLKNETEKAKDALPLMKFLKALKSKYGLSILALAHTPKRDLSKPITRNDLSGSKMLMNFCDSCFSIGESQKDKNIRYIKQIKVRQSEFKFDSENVCVCEIHKPHNFLSFEFHSYGIEREHLKEVTEKDIEQKISEVLELKNQGVSNTEIANKYGVTEGAVRKWLKKSNYANR